MSVHYEAGLDRTSYTLDSVASCRPVPTVAVTVKISTLPALRVADVAPISTVMAAASAWVSDVQLPVVLASVAVTVIEPSMEVVFHA